MTAPVRGLPGGEKIANIDARLPQNSSERTLGHVAVMAGKRYFSAATFMTPHFVAPGSHPIEPPADTS